MPTIAEYFNASIATTKNTISIMLLGLTIGAFVFGILIDSVGRKKVLVYCLFLYTLISLIAPFCRAIDQLVSPEKVF